MPESVAHDRRVVAAWAARVLERVDELAEAFATAIVAEEPVYGRRYERDELVRASTANLGALVRALADPTERLDLASAEATGRRNAEGGVLLESLLHLYRMASRAVWEELLRQAADFGPEGTTALLHAAAEVWELIDRQSRVVASAYHATEADIARSDAERRAALADDLLSGLAPPAHVREAAVALGLREGDALHAIAAQVAATSVADVERRLARAGVASAWRRAGDLVVGVVAPPQQGEGLAPTLARVLERPAGCSPAFTELSAIPAALELAQLALRAASGSAGVALVDEHLPAALLVRSPDLAARLGAVLDDLERRRDGDELMATLGAWFAADGSVDEVAARLYVHRNTVFNRLRRVQETTGLRLDRPADVVRIALALAARRVLRALGADGGTDASGALSPR